MKIFHGTIESVSDPSSQGRVKVKLIGFREKSDDHPAGNVTKWCHVCMPFAGPGYGFFCLPQVGDEALATMTASGDWIVLGYHWSGRTAKPSTGSATVRVFKTPVGHKLQFSENGDIAITSGGGAEILVKANGQIYLNGSDGEGIVTKKCICAYTGSDHPQSSTTVKADK